MRKLQPMATGIAVVLLLLGVMDSAPAQEPTREQMQSDLDKARRNKVDQASQGKAAQDEAARERAATAARQATLVIRSDAPCQLSVDGKRIATLQAGKAQTLTVVSGKTLVECQTTTDASLKYAATHDVKAGTNAVVQVELPAKDTAAPAARDADRERAAAAAQVQDKRAAKDARFVALGDGNLHDTQRKIAWAQSDNGSNIDWNGAKAHCAGKGAGWSLATAEELISIYDASGDTKTPCGQSTCKVSNRFRLTSYWFWTNEAVGPFKARLVSLDRGYLYSDVVGGALYNRALCVRRS